LTVAFALIAFAVWVLWLVGSRSQILSNRLALVEAQLQMALGLLYAKDVMTPDEMAHMHLVIREADPAKYEELRRDLASRGMNIEEDLGPVAQAHQATGYRP
jgi:hypothetical protein